MNRIASLSFSLALALAGLGGCSSGSSVKESKKAARTPDRIQGKVLEIVSETNATDVAMNAGGPSVYLVDGLRRYRLFFRKAWEVDQTKQYIAEGVYAQKVIDEIGDPDQGKNGYPLPSSCDRVINMAWPGLAIDVEDLSAKVLCAKVKRYPARPVFLVTRLLPATAAESGAAKKEADDSAPEVTVAADKQRALLIEGPTVLSAPLWAPAGGTVSCKLVIDTEGKVSQLETGLQLCESVPWSQFRYKPTMRGNRAVDVETSVEVRFEPRKQNPD